MFPNRPVITNAVLSGESRKASSLLDRLRKHRWVSRWLPLGGMNFRERNLTAPGRYGVKSNLPLIIQTAFLNGSVRKLYAITGTRHGVAVGIYQMHFDPRRLARHNLLLAGRRLRHLVHLRL